MPLEDSTMNCLKIQHAITSFVLVAGLCLTASTLSSADERTRCQSRVQNAEQHYRHEWRTERDWDRNYDWDRER